MLYSVPPSSFCEALGIRCSGFFLMFFAPWLLLFLCFAVGPLWAMVPPAMPMLWHGLSTDHSSLHDVPALAWSASFQDCISHFHVSPPLSLPKSPHISYLEGEALQYDWAEMSCAALISWGFGMQWPVIVLSKLAESSCAWHGWVHGLLPCSPLLLKAWQICPIHSSYAMHFQISRAPFLFSKG